MFDRVWQYVIHVNDNYSMGIQHNNLHVLVWTYPTVSGSWTKTSFTSYLGLSGFASFIVNLTEYFFNVWSLRLSKTFLLLFRTLQSIEESERTIESLTTEYGDSPGWIALLRLWRKPKARITAMFIILWNLTFEYQMPNSVLTSINQISKHKCKFPPESVYLQYVFASILPRQICRSILSSHLSNLEVCWNFSKVCLGLPWQTIRGKQQDTVGLNVLTYPLCQVQLL